MEKTIGTMASCVASLALLVLGTRTMPMHPKAHRVEASSSPKFLLVIDVPSENTTTTTTTAIVIVTTTAPETTTTEPPVVRTTVTTRPVIRTTTTEPYIPATTLPIARSVSTGGPPHNTTSLVGCIAYWESTWGKDPNVFQFTLGTWHIYGGKGSPEDAEYSVQEEIFWVAWEDNGYHHWAAQKGRCF